MDTASDARPARLHCAKGEYKPCSVSGRAQSKHTAPALPRAARPPAVCTHNHPFICRSVATRPVKTRLFGMPGGKCHPQKRTPLLRHLRCKQSPAAQGQALAQSSSDFPSYFFRQQEANQCALVASQGTQAENLWQNESREFFSQELPRAQYSRSTADILKKPKKGLK